MTRTEYDVVALGELLIDFTAQGAGADGYPLMAAHPGGAPANFLAAIARLGGRTALLSKVGADAFGTMLTGTLREVGVDTRGVHSGAVRHAARLCDLRRGRLRVCKPEGAGPCGRSQGPDGHGHHGRGRHFRRLRGVEAAPKRQGSRSAGRGGAARHRGICLPRRRTLHRKKRRHLRDHGDAGRGLYGVMGAAQSPTPAWITLPMFHRCATCLAAARRSSGVS